MTDIIAAARVRRTRVVVHLASQPVRTSDKITQDGITQDGITQDGITQDGITQDGITQDGIRWCGPVTRGLCGERRV